jgi:tetratricopeptide (TPR) repeat protein
MSEEQKSRETAGQNEVSQEGTEPKRTDVERVEEAAQAIVRAIETGSDRFWEAQVEAQARATKPKNPLVGTMLFVASTWVVFFALVSLFTLLVGWALYGISPLHSLEQIAYAQEQRQRQDEQAKAKEAMGDYYVDLGNSLLNVGEAKAAKEQFETALELDPFSQEAQEGKLKSDLFESVEAKDYELAVIQPKLDRLADERPKDTHVYAFRGTVLSYAQPDSALKQFKEAVRLDPSNAHAYNGQSFIYYSKHEYDKALEMSKEARDLAPWNPNYKHNYANDLMINERYEEASKEYTDVTELDSQFIFPYHDLAYVYRLMDNLSLSRWYYDQYIAMLNDDKIMSLERNSVPGYVLIAKSDGSVAALVELSDKLYHAYYSLALALHLMGRTNDAQEYVNKANDLQVDPDLERQIKAALQYDIGLLQEEQEHFREVANEFSGKFLASPPN